MQGHLVDLDVDGEPGVLHGVAGEVLHAGHHVALQAPGEGGPELAHVMGVLAVGLLGPTPRRVAQEVDAHGAGQVRPDGPQLLADGLPHPLLEDGVPGRAAGHGHREAGGVADHCPAGPVAEPDPREADPLHLGAVAGGPVVAVIGQEAEPRPRRQVTVEAPQPLLRAQAGDEGPGDLSGRRSPCYGAAGVLEGLDLHRSQATPLDRLTC